MPRVRITLNDGSTREVQFEDGFTDSDIEEVAGQLNAQIKPVQQKPVTQPKPQSQPQTQPQPQANKSYNPDYADILNNNSLTKEQKVQAIKERGEAIQKKIDNDYKKDMAKLIGGAVLEIGSAAIPMGAGARLAGSAIKALTPYVGRKIAQEVGTGLVAGGLSGGVFGAGRGLIENKNPIVTAGQDALLGTATGGAIGGAVGKVSKTVSGKRLNKIENLQDLRKAETDYYKNYLQQTKVTRKDLGDIDFTQAGLETVSKQPEAGRNFASLKNDIKNAEYLGAEDLNHPRNDGIVKFHRLEKDGQQFLIGETKDGKKYYMSKTKDELTDRPSRVGANSPTNSITDNAQNFNPSEKITKKGLENQAKELKKEIADSKVDLTPKTTVSMAKQGHFWSRNIDDPMTKSIRGAEEELNSIVSEIQKNPEIVKDSAKFEALQDRLSSKLGIADEVDQEFYNKFYEAATKAEEAVDTLALAGDYTQRGLPNTIINAKGTPKEIKKILKQDFPEYKILHNNELTDQAVKEIESNFNNELSRLTSAKDFEALDYEKSRQIAKRLFDMGRHEEAINLIDNVSENATKKGQAIQALSLWSNMTPEGAVFKAEKLINEYNKKVPARKQVKLTDEQIEKIRELQNAALNTTDDLSKTQGLARTAKYVSELVPKNIGQKLKAYRNISLLLNPKTLGRNIIGNTLFNAVDTVSKAAAVPIDRVLGKIPNNRFFSTVEKTREYPQLKEFVKGGLKGAKTGFNEALEGIDTRGLGKRYDLQEGRTFKNPIMKGLETGLDIGLRVPDRVQYEATFAESVANMMKAQGLKEPTQEILEQAEREALESVFQNDSAISSIITKVRKGLNTKQGDFGIGDLAIPYAQTPANLVQQAINYSPAGLIKGGANLLQGNQRQASLDLARALLGSGIITGSYGLSKTGAITPSQFDDTYKTNKLIKSNLATMGIKPESINGLWYAPFQPMSTSVAIGNAMANGEDPLQAGINTMLDLPFLQNLNRTISDVRDKGPADALVNFTGSLPAQFVPTVASQLGQTIDPIQRETYDSNKLKQGINQAIAKMPIASKTLPEKIDVQGKPIERYTSEGLQRMFDIFVNPTYLNEPTNDTVMNELKALYDVTGDTKQFLPVVERKIKYKDENGVEHKIELTGEQFSNYQKVLGSRLYKEYAELMQTNRYQNADDETRINLLSKGRQKATNEVEAELFNKPNIQSRKKVKDPTAKLKRLQNKIDKQLIDTIFTE